MPQGMHCGGTRDCNQEHFMRAVTLSRPDQAGSPDRRRRSLGVRGMIVAVGAAGMIAAMTVGGFAVVGLGHAGDARAKVHALQEARSRTQEIEYYNGDVSGWQVAYAWDARRIGPVAAVKPDAGNRAGFLADAALLRDVLKKMPTDVLTRTEKANFETIVADWDKFFAFDDQVVALYNQDTPASTDAADALILGDSYNVYFEIIDLTHKLRSSVEKRAGEASN